MQLISNPKKEQTLKNIDENKASVLRNWEVISLVFLT